MRNEVKKLDQLTSLRFFAAMMIVIVHGRGVFEYVVHLRLGQGVSFFYVLSGFILYFVYPRLDSWEATRKFLRARIARIWPAYLASFALGFWLAGYHWETRTALVHLAMLQSWIPLPDYYYSYNAVAWSVSTEFFFYLAFPLLLLAWDRTWWWKLPLMAVPIVALIAWTAPLALPVHGGPGPEGMQLTLQGLLYNHPVSRIFEFALGMGIGLAWRKFEVRWSNATATGLEIGTVALCLLSLYAMNQDPFWRARLGTPAALWLCESGGSALAFAMLIYVMAHGRGTVSRWLAHPLLVLLGEISFSIYLIHYMLLAYLRANKAVLMHVPNPVAFAIYLAVLLLASYLLWTFVEMPGRRLLLGRARVHGSSALTRNWRDHVTVGRGAVIASVSLAALVALVHFTKVAADAPTRVAADTAEVRLPAPASCNIETANAVRFKDGPVRVDGDGGVIVEGWLLPESTKRTGAPASVRLSSDAGGGHWDFPVQAWLPRPQVLAVMGGVDGGNAGFRQRLDLAGLAPGKYRLTVAFTDGRAAYLCDKNTWLQLD